MGALTSTGGTERAGDIKFHAANAIPYGWLKANGAAVSRTAYAALFAAIGTTYGAGDGAATFNLPDLRGEFLRGFDDARAVDSGRVFGSLQQEGFKSHRHYYGAAAGTSEANQLDVYGVAALSSITHGTAAVGATGGGETRPRNVAMLACIKY